MVWPPNQMSLRARAPRESLAMRTAPAAVRRAVTVASAVGMRLRKGLGAVGCGDIGGVEEIFCAPGDSVERTAVVASGNFGVGGFGLREGVVAGEGDDAVDLWV